MLNRLGLNKEIYYKNKNKKFFNQKTQKNGT